MASDEAHAYEIMRELDVDYVLVIFGGLISYSSDGKYEQMLYIITRSLTSIKIYVVWLNTILARKQYSIFILDIKKALYVF